MFQRYGADVLVHVIHLLFAIAHKATSVQYMELNPMKKPFFNRFAGLTLSFWLIACTALPSHSQERDTFPGGSPYYSYGVSQSKENFVNVERAQSDYSLHKGQRTWAETKPRVSPGEFNMLQSYYPLSVRWQLKDGRQFIAENIDVRAIMREYFKSNDIKLPWQKEGRPRDGKGDYNPSLVHEVKDDTVIIKWHVITNTTPVNERFTASGAATRWQRTREEFVVTTIKGTPTSGIDFEKKWEFNK